MNRWTLDLSRVLYLILALGLVFTTSAWADTIHDSEVINTDTTWYAADNDHIVIGSVSVGSAATLTIEDGCVVRFEHGALLSVSGTLDAIGSPGEGILFSRRAAEDEWSGLRFYSSSVGDLQYCTIEYGTRSTGYGIYADGVLPSIENCTIRNNDYGIYVQGVASPTLSVANTFQDNFVGALWIYNCTNPSVSNQTMTGHTGASGAIYMDRTGEFHIGTGNDITGNNWGLSMNLDSYPDAMSSGNIPMAGNTNDDGIRVDGGSSGASVIWRDVDADYIVTSSPAVNGSGMLTIEDGVTVRFDHGNLMSVYGTLNAIGSPGEGIPFSRRAAEDEWSGLRFYSSSVGDLQYCTIEYGTRSTGYGIYADGASPNLEDCTIHNNDYGIYVNNASPRVVRCQIIDNHIYGIYLTGACVPTFGTSLSEWNDIYGNGAGSVDRDLCNGTEDIDAHYVYWGTLDQIEIEEGIHHEPDDEALGRVNSSPWTNAAHDSAYYATGTDVEESGVALPGAFSLSQNMPNPFNPVTKIAYALPQDCWVELEVLDCRGRRIATLVSGYEAAGFKVCPWNARGIASGTYFYRLKAGDFEETRKMLLIR